MAFEHRHILRLPRFAAGCAKREKKSDAEKARAGDGRLVIGMQQEPEILNEAVNSMVASVYVCNLIFSKFVKYNDRLELVPDLIEEIPTVENGGISSDYLTYTYRIRRNARWHDGVPVTSYDAKFSYEVMMHPDINVETRQGWDIVERVETPDSFTVVFHLREVYANFVGDCFYDESVLPRHLLKEALGPEFQNAAFHRRPIGSGPFVFKEWVSGSHIVVQASRDYYGEGPWLDEIVIKFIPEDQALVMQLETGEIAGVDNAPNTALAAVGKTPGARLFRNAALFNEHLDLNCDHPILRDRLVRRALALATDRKEISDKIYDGVWVPAFGDDYPRSAYYSAAVETLNAFDPARAAALLAEAGWIDRDGDGIREKNGAPLALAISAMTGNLNRERTEMVLREQYRRIGVDLTDQELHARRALRELGRRRRPPPRHVRYRPVRRSHAARSLDEGRHLFRGIHSAEGAEFHAHQEREALAPPRRGRPDGRLRRAQEESTTRRPQSSPPKRR